MGGTMNLSAGFVNSNVQPSHARSCLATNHRVSGLVQRNVARRINLETQDIRPDKPGSLI